MKQSLEGIKNIIFDLGGVILNIDYQKTIFEFEKLGVLNFADIFSQSNQNNASDKFEIGEISEQEFYESIKEKSGVEFSFMQFQFAWNSMLLDLPVERIELLKKIKNKYRLFLFSNTNETHFNKFNNSVKSDFDKIFEKKYYSHQFGHRKPNNSSFEIILNENNLSKSETLFIDDSIQHIEAANNVGLQTIYYNNTSLSQIFG